MGEGVILTFKKNQHERQKGNTALKGEGGSIIQSGSDALFLQVRATGTCARRVIEEGSQAKSAAGWTACRARALGTGELRLGVGEEAARDIASQIQEQETYGSMSKNQDWTRQEKDESCRDILW